MAATSANGPERTQILCPASSSTLHHRLQGLRTPTGPNFNCDETRYGQLQRRLAQVLAAVRTRSVPNIISQPYGLPHPLRTSHFARPVIALSITDRRNLSRARTQPASQWHQALWTLTHFSSRPPRKLSKSSNRRTTKPATLTPVRMTATATAATDTVIVVTAAGTAVTAEATGVEAATATNVDEMTVGPVRVEVTMTDTDAAARATVTVEDEGTEAVITTAAEDACVRAPHAVTGHAVSEKDLAIASVVVMIAREGAVRRPLPQKLQKTIVTSVLSSSSRSPNEPRHAISARFSRPSGPLSKLRLLRTESLVARRGKLIISRTVGLC